MRVCRTQAELRAARAALAQPVGFVPTMGALHDGHASLVARSRADCSATIVSIYVNPLQFAPGEDFARYPRPFDADAAVLERAGVDVLFAPDDQTMYPPGAQTTVDPGPLAHHLEGERRPGHFRGVATVVLKLLHMVAPQRVYFGQKDAQQLAVVRRMVADLGVGVEVVACPTVRERDGLALSSRNRYLDETQRQEALGLSRALGIMVAAARSGETSTAAAVQTAQAQLGGLRLDYLAFVEPSVFKPLERLPQHASLLAVGAAFCGTTRLIDNMELQTP